MDDLIWCVLVCFIHYFHAFTRLYGLRLETTVPPQPICIIYLGKQHFQPRPRCINCAKIRTVLLTCSFSRFRDGVFICYDSRIPSAPLSLPAFLFTHLSVMHFQQLQNEILIDFFQGYASLLMYPTLRTKFMKHKVKTRTWGVETEVNKSEHQEVIKEGRK